MPSQKPNLLLPSHGQHAMRPDYQMPFARELQVLHPNDLPVVTMLQKQLEDLNDLRDLVLQGDIPKIQDVLKEKVKPFYYQVDSV